MATNQTSVPANTTTTTSSSTPPTATNQEMADHIKTAHAAVLEATRNVVLRAIAVGELLNNMKEKVGHGTWNSWRKTYCPDIPERTAQRYMELAENKPKLEAILQTKSAKLANLTISEALQLIKSGDSSSGSGSTGGSRNASDTYDKAETKLITKLKTLALAEAEAAAKATIDKLNQTVNEKKQAVAAESKLKKAA
jgi:hypothetical protein